ncbi:unnamed protein product [Prorocentrum cordatum]|uniref:Uncharacterized protein n=1 Tax=Prorocentrum cordatum TaxID=2364126 RepID=A0ABN9VKF8_9DINO|nr:unnamed protein product [Polarella glacialis]
MAKLAPQHLPIWPRGCPVKARAVLASAKPRLLADSCAFSDPFGEGRGRNGEPTRPPSSFSWPQPEGVHGRLAGYSRPSGELVPRASAWRSLSGVPWRGLSLAGEGVRVGRLARLILAVGLVFFARARAPTVAEPSANPASTMRFFTSVPSSAHPCRAFEIAPPTAALL